jgi:3'(2'), 5'-bisphosphate nucleotidase
LAGTARIAELPDPTRIHWTCRPANKERRTPVSACELQADEAARVMPELSALVARASAAILAISHTAARRKADGSPVTEADDAAEALILEGLSRLLPGVPVVSEERIGREAPPKLDGSFVLVDPLDGTKELVAGRDEYTVNIALISGGAAIAGVIGAPARRLLWRGIFEKGAERLQMADAKLSAAEPIHSRAWPQHGAVALVSRSHPDAATDAVLARLPAINIQACGSSLKFCRIAEGTADVYPRLGPTSEWDIAAGHALVAAAGGAMTTPDGRPLVYGGALENFRVNGFIAWGDRNKAFAG